MATELSPSAEENHDMQMKAPEKANNNVFVRIVVCETVYK